MRVRTLSVAALLAVGTVLGGTSQALADDGPSADAHVANSPGLLSGNAVQLPIDLGVNLCGNTVDVIGLLNPATGNHCKTN
ncbi:MULTISPECIES: chaplin [unclassified Streptomyces]|uniref:chaplin n=1 Tax=unclassified Streptomyces TaxID=2593676 RepID=UPI0033E9A220